MSGDNNGVDATTAPSTQQTLNRLANGEHLKQKRARSQLSCIPCRTGKLKCNRSHDPACDQCIKRNREGQCSYVPPPAKQRGTQNVKGRVRQLENLVVELMNQQTQSNQRSVHSDTHMRTQYPQEAQSRANREAIELEQLTPPGDNDSHRNGSLSGKDEDINETTKPFGRMRISKNEISYVGETHWQAILNGISDLKRELSEDEEGDTEEAATQETDSDARQVWGNAFGNVPLNDLPHQSIGSQGHGDRCLGLGFMLGNATAVTREQLIKSVPEKKVADRLLSLWFNSPDPFKPVLHAPAFQEQYRRFWRDPKDTPTMWLGLLFSILSLAASFGLRDIDPTSDGAKKILAQVNQYHTLAGSAAVLADFTKPKEHTLECLIFYAAGLRSNNAFINVWLMIGLIIRLALRMGYHRDPSNYPAISPFESEMRRRVWAIISMIDVLISFQLGLPSMVRTLQSDTEPPRNLLDRDFNANDKALPPSRGVEELTPSSYTRAKLKIVRVFADASEMSHATIPPAQDAIIALDHSLEEAKAQVPPLLQMPEISELVTDPAEQLMCRFNLDLLYLKTKMVLHRRYLEQPFAQLSLPEQQLGIGFSRKTCLDSALKVLQHHHTIYVATQPGGQLESVRWYMGSISTHDFLLAAMIVCLELSQQISDDQAITGNLICPKRAEMMDALEKSQKIWSDTSRKKVPNSFNASGTHSKGEHMYDETEKASRAMAAMLRRVKQKFPQQADAMRRAEQNEAPQRPGMGVSNGPPREDFGDIRNVNFAASPSMPFGGIVSYHNWGDTSTTTSTTTKNWPPYLDNSSLRASSTDGSSDNNIFSFTPQPSASTDTSPPDPSLDFSDLSMINTMLDIPGAVDWDMFDAGVIQNPTASSTNPTHTSSYGAFDFNGAAGNAMIGSGTGPGSGQMPDVWVGTGMPVDFDMGYGEEWIHMPEQGSVPTANGQHDGTI